jgi:hypothetical protein
VFKDWLRTLKHDQLDKTRGSDLKAIEADIQNVPYDIINHIRRKSNRESPGRFVRVKTERRTNLLLFCISSLAPKWCSAHAPNRPFQGAALFQKVSGPALPSRGTNLVPETAFYSFLGKLKIK